MASPFRRLGKSLIFSMENVCVRRQVQWPWKRPEAFTVESRTSCAGVWPVFLQSLPKVQPGKGLGARKSKYAEKHNRIPPLLEARSNVSRPFHQVPVVII